MPAEVANVPKNAAIIARVNALMPISPLLDAIIMIEANAISLCTRTIQRVRLNHYTESPELFGATFSMGPQNCAHKFAFPGRGRALSAVALSLLAWSAAADQLETVTVEAAREREMVVQQVTKFVSGIAVLRRDQSLANWQREIPICPLVAGLSREDGEFMLRRLSQIAVSVGAPLAAEGCKPNLYVVVSSAPDALLKAWSKRDVTMFDSADDHGGVEIRNFLNAKLPVRAWYNVEIYNSDGTPLDHLGAAPGMAGFAMSGVRINAHSRATRIQFNDVPCGNQNRRQCVRYAQYLAVVRQFRKSGTFRTQRVRSGLS